MIQSLPRFILSFAIGLLCLESLHADDANALEFTAQDSIAAEQRDDNPDAADCLTKLSWRPTTFKVQVHAAGDQPYDYLVRFPSPHPSGNASNDMVNVEWYAVRNDADELVAAPTVVVVHESGSAMEIGHLFARNLRAKGLHAFMVQLPYYGERRAELKNPPTEKMLATMRQGIADVRRARDAVAAIPQIAGQRIGLQGTSLGGFVAATAGGFDACYDRVFIMLAGGDLAGMIEHGEKDTAKFRDKMLAAGYSIEQIRELLWQVEPTRVAHRLPANTTWVYSAIYDRVVPLENGSALAAAIGISSAHHVRLPGNHYTTIIYFPWIVNHIANSMTAEEQQDDVAE